MRQNGLDFCGSEHYRHPFGAACPFDVLDVGQLYMKHLPVEKEQRREGHLLG